MMVTVSFAPGTYKGKNLQDTNSIMKIDLSRRPTWSGIEIDKVASTGAASRERVPADLSAQGNTTEGEKKKEAVFV